jgi:CDP-diacylglycerol--glycerol-3-phosphate 3-phosphatidyltransferase
MHIMTVLSRVRKVVSVFITDPIVNILIKTPLTPNMLTCLSFLLAAGAAALIAYGYLLAAGFLVLFGSFLDMLDGALARRMDRATRFGAVLDSTLDRMSEGIILLAILYVYAADVSVGGVLLVGVVMLSSMLVSYIRARAEAAGIVCTVGLFTRPERVIVLALGLFINQLFIALAIIAAFSLFTAGHRLFYVWRRAKDRQY